jgi:acetyltransferase-like isoleucine patch superfamily enzyme
MGDGAVVGARAVVVRDVEPWTVVVGNPATKIKDRVMRSTARAAAAAADEPSTGAPAR